MPQVGIRYGEGEMLRERRSASAITPDRQLKVWQNKVAFFDGEIEKLAIERDKVVKMIEELEKTLTPVEEAPKATKLVKKKDATDKPDLPDASS